MDAGKTWKNVGLTNVGLIGAVEIHPTNPNLVYIAAIGQPFQPNLRSLKDLAISNKLVE